MYCRVKNNKVVEIFSYNPFEWIPNDEFLSNCYECDYAEIGYRYKDGQFYAETQAEKREIAYNIEKIIDWNGLITVDEANSIFLKYFAEGNAKSNEIQSLIITAKETIRNKYPDEVTIC